MTKASFRDIPQFTRDANYAVDVPWGYLEEWLAGHNKDGCTLDMDPDFQRGHVWNDAKRRRYVEFVLRGGSSARNILWNSKGWPNEVFEPILLVDGKQRMEAVRKFMRSELPIFIGEHLGDGSESAMASYSGSDGYLYSDFSGKLGITGPSFRMCVNSLRTREEVLIWYLETNEGGVVHTKQELDKVRTLLEIEQCDGDMELLK